MTLTPFVCPVCLHDAEPVIQVHEVAVCASCGASVRLGEDAPRRASVSDLQGLTALEFADLGRARAAIARPTRRQR